MYKNDTVCVHPTRCPKAVYGALATPIFQSATFAHEGVDIESEYSYSRLQNPTRAALEARVAELEGGVDAIAFASGMAAETTLMNLFEFQGHIIASTPTPRLPCPPSCQGQCPRLCQERS